MRELEVSIACKSQVSKATKWKTQQYLSLDRSPDLFILTVSQPADFLLNPGETDTELALPNYHTRQRNNSKTSYT